MEARQVASGRGCLGPEHNLAFIWPVHQASEGGGSRLAVRAPIDPGRGKGTGVQQEPWSG